MPKPIKPPALLPGSAIRIIASASPVEEIRLGRGCDELARIGYLPRWDPRVLAADGFFAGTPEDRLAVLKSALEDSEARAIVCARGGYGSSYLLEWLNPKRLRSPKIVIGFSDISSLQVYFWQRMHWVGFYGPMAAAGFEAGANTPNGYDAESFARAVTEIRRGWSIDLRGEILLPGRDSGILLGGCLTLLVATLGTPWELDTRGALLLLEDRGMKPFQVDRAIMQLKQSGKLRNVRGFILGEFPECDAPPGSSTVRQVVERLLLPLGVPVVWGAPIGHTPRPILTVPLGVRARLVAHGTGRLDILEPAVREAPKKSVGGRSSRTA